VPLAPPPSHAPTDGLSYDPEEPKYWDPGALRKEVERTFDICHGCRLCFKYCDAFPNLFSFIDDKHDGNARAVTDRETARVMDDCFQCKLCEVSCPYTPRDKHPFALDFPRLVHRYKAQRARAEGVPLRERILGDPDGVAEAARLGGGLADRLNRSAAHRVLLEKTLGVHRDKKLPSFASETFETWASGAGLMTGPPGGEAVLFPTCYVQNNDPGIGRDTVEVLRANGVDLRGARDLGCCGMPAWESGDLEELRRRARRNLDVLMPFVDAGAKVIALSPTCALLMRQDYPTLVARPERPRARRLAAAVRDPAEYLLSIRAEPRFNRALKSRPDKVAYHVPCHLRAQAVGLAGRDLLRRLGVDEIATVAACCGHDGTYAMKVESFEAARRIGGKAFAGMQSAEGKTWVTDCPLAALQIEQHAGPKTLHPMSLLARAYRGDRFAEGSQESEASQDPQQTQGPEDP
jgi:glycerol-3-phosphate dehydrogenase subunit C